MKRETMTTETTSKKLTLDNFEEFDPAKYLDNEEAIAAFLTDILADNNPALLAGALGVIDRARGMSEIARASGIQLRDHGTRNDVGEAISGRRLFEALKR